MNHSLYGALCLILATFALAQDKPPIKKVRRSLAEGLVRQIIESERLDPPRLQSGLEMARGRGPLALLVRKKDGSLSVRPLQRGYGDHGTGAKPSNSPIVEIEEIEEGKAPKKRDVHTSHGAAHLRIRQDGKILRILSGSSKPILEGSPIDRKKLTTALKALLAETTKGKSAGSLVLSATRDVSMRDLLTTWEIARSVGFRTVAFSGTLSKPTDADRMTLRTSLKKLSWKREGILSEGELLILLDGDSKWKHIGPLITEAARGGIWQLAFVGQRDRKTRFKIPAHLPVDPGIR